MTLANILRVDAPPITGLCLMTLRLVQAIAVLARAQQDAVGNRHPRAQPAPLTSARVLPGRPDGVRGQGRRLDQPRSPRGSGRRAGTGRCGEPHEDPSSGAPLAGQDASAISTPNLPALRTSCATSTLRQPPRVEARDRPAKLRRCSPNSTPPVTPADDLAERHPRRPLHQHPDAADHHQLPRVGGR